MPQLASTDYSQITALLGPTNTGKTHRAVERMLEHASGMIGLPLRLLAREIYDRITAVRGEQQVALVTGEEKRIPVKPRYWVCTVEAMPVDRVVDFLAVDEIQLAEHAQRGHKFTERLLNARGRCETWFMGADTMRGLVEQLVPTAEIHRHARFSRLHAVDTMSLSSLPPRTAVIAFTAAEVYQLAERLRQKRGGAAVVLGALSPRTRNAQVAMYQAGEVDFMVATDAIGMGLNMDIDQVAFASLRKFDGLRRRALSPAELGQIAGRAGRHVRDGKFGVLKPADLSPKLAFAIESHRFAPVRKLVWRNSDLDFNSIDTLRASLKVRPPRRSLRLVERADDTAALDKLVEQAEIKKAARGAEAVKLLWSVCCIPDFRKLLLDQHATLLGEVFMQLARPQSSLDEDFLDKRIRRLENDQGPIDTLMMRMEFIRTWSYIVHHPGWLADATAWQERTRMAEDRLSQALHERLTERFVDRRGRSGGRGRQRSRSRGRKPRPAEVVEVEQRSGPFSKLSALRDALPANDESVISADEDWVDALVDAPHESFVLDRQGHICDGDRAIARLVRGSDLLHPEIKLVLDKVSGAGAELRLMRRMRAWVRDLLSGVLAPLQSLPLGELSGSGRGLLYQLEKQLGTVETKAARTQVQSLNKADRQRLAEAEIVVADRFVYARAALAPDLVQQRSILCGVWCDARAVGPDGCSLTVAVQPAWPDAMYLATGYARFGPRAIRVDVCDRVDERLREASSSGPFALPPELAAWLDCSKDELEALVIAFGYHVTAEGFVRSRRRRRRRAKRAKRGKNDRSA